MIKKKHTESRREFWNQRIELIKLISIIKTNIINLENKHIKHFVARHQKQIQKEREYMRKDDNKGWRCF